MNDLFLPAGLVISALTIVLYVVHCIKYKSQPDLGDAVMLFLSGNGIVTGIKVCFLGYFLKASSGLSGDKIYIILGGVAVTWVSIQSIYRTISLATLGGDFGSDQARSL